MRCPGCAARNAEDAAWCTQCFASLTRLTGARETGVPALEERIPAVSAAVASDGAVDPTPVTPHDVRERDGEVEWRCRGCERWSRLAIATCGTCGTGRTGFGEDRDPGRRVVGVGTAVTASLLLPGLGHLLAGAVGSGLARAVLWVVWAGAGLGDLRGARGSLAAVSLAAVSLAAVSLVGALVLWAASAIDAASLAGGTGRQLLEGRRMVALVAVVTAGMLLAVSAALPGG
jgi:hypothetical protein